MLSGTAALKHLLLEMKVEENPYEEAFLFLIIIIIKLPRISLIEGY